MGKVYPPELKKYMDKQVSGKLNTFYMTSHHFPAETFAKLRN